MSIIDIGKKRNNKYDIKSDQHQINKKVVDYIGDDEDIYEEPIENEEGIDIEDAKDFIFDYIKERLDGVKNISDKHYIVNDLIKYLRQLSIEYNQSL